MSAAGLIILILFLLAVGMVFYYAVLCYQAQAFSGKRPEYSDMGPLLSHDHDFNGNNEAEILSSNIVASTLGKVDNEGSDDVSVVDEDRVADSEVRKPPHESINLQSAPECASTASNGNDTVILTMEEEPYLSSTAKSIRDRDLCTASQPTTSTPLHSNKTESEQPRIIDVPVIYSLENHSRKAMSVSFEEDGLLVPRSNVSTISNTLTVSSPLQSSSEILNNSGETVDSSCQPPLSLNQPPPVSKEQSPFSPLTIDTPNISFNKLQELNRGDVQPSVFLFASSNSPTTETNEILTAFSPKHKGEEGGETPCKKVKMSPIEHFCTSDNLKKVLTSSVAPVLSPAEVSHQADRDDSELDVSVPFISKDSETQAENTHFQTDNDGDYNHPANESISTELDKQIVQNDSVCSTEKNSIASDSKSPDLQNAMRDDNQLKGDSNMKGESETDLPVVKNIGWNVSLELSENPDNDSSQKNENNLDEQVNIPVSNGNDGTIDSDSSDPEVTEYSFRDGPPLPSTTAVLAGEVGYYSDDVVDLTHFSSLDAHTLAREHHALVDDENESLVITNNTAFEAHPDAPKNPNSEKQISSKTTHSRNLSSSSSSSSSSSASNGSYAIETPKQDVQGTNTPLQTK